jgi:arylsulfatase A-like enzyme
MAIDVSRRAVLGMIASQVAAASIAQAIPVARKETQPPNVIFLLADDVGYGDLASLGNPVIKTPNLDDLHNKGIRFTNFHVSPTCAPTRASLMTGRYCNATGVWHTIEGRSLIDPQNTTLAECFKSSGYKTAIYGKWHLGDNYPCRPHDLGFDDVVVCGGGGIAQTPDYFGNDNIDDTYLHNGKFQKYTGFSTDIFFDLAMDFMAEARKETKPFFCYLPTTAAHQPCWSTEKDAAPYLGVTGLKTPGFYGMIANIDENLGRLMRFLNEQDLAENTIVMYAGDNGSQDGVGVYNASMRGEKSSPYEGGHRVPLFIYWPAGNLSGGRDIDTLTAHIDILPTLAELCSLKDRGKNVDGVSLCPLLSGDRGKWKDRPVVVVDSQRGEDLIKWKEAAVMTQRWRLVNSSPDGDLSRIELFDLPKDPGQQVNVASKHPEVVRELIAHYDAWWGKLPVNPDKYVRIVLGSDRENPSRLDCMDWHSDDSGEVWNQSQIRTAPAANGFWTVDISQSGNYKFELRRWPREVDLAINAAFPANAPYKNGRPNRDKSPGKAIAAVKAHIMIGNFHQAKEIPDGARFVEFTLPLSSGPAELRTTFYDKNEDARGAYYVYVERT